MKFGIIIESGQLESLEKLVGRLVMVYALKSCLKTIRTKTANQKKDVATFAAQDRLMRI